LGDRQRRAGRVDEPISANLAARKIWHSMNRYAVFDWSDKKENKGVLLFMAGYQVAC